MKFTILIISLLMLLIWESCGVSEATMYIDNKECKSVVEGSYISNIRYDRKCPTIVFKKFHSPLIQYGKLVEINDTGVVFDPDRSGPFFDQDPTFYPNEDFDCVVDSEGYAVVGNIPERFQVICNMEWEIVNINDQSKSPLKLVFHSGEHFAYCLEAGTYSVRKVYFKADLELGYKWEDESINNNEIIFSVEINRTNYLGNMLLDFPITDSTTSRSIFCNIVHRLEKGQSGNAAFCCGLFSPLLGLMISATAPRYDKYILHRLQIYTDPNYKTITSLPTVNTSLTWKMRTQ